MNWYILIILLLVSGAAVVSAQETIIFKNKSKIYDVKVSYDKCSDEDEKKACDDKSTFYLLKKNQTQIFQTVEMAETYVTLPLERRKKDGITELSGKDGSGVYFMDYNFDGIEDLGIGNGNYLPYGGISYDVFLHSKAEGKFVRHEELSRLETEVMSLKIDKKLKILETQTKIGCCWHEKARYRFVNNRLQKFYVFTEDAMGGKWVDLITERRVKGKWQTTSRRVLMSKYYQD